MPIVEYIRESKQTESAVGVVLKYCTQKKKSMHEGRNLVTGINCHPSTAQQEFKRTRLMHGKDTGVRFYMTIQSFEKGVNLTPSQVHEIGCKLVQEFYPNYEVVVSTHVDREHVHNHFVINSVNMETGIKLHQNKHTLKELRRVSDRIALEYGIQQPIQLHKEKGLSPREYRAAEKGMSWKFKLMNAIDRCMNEAQSKNEFIDKMQKSGYTVKYNDNYKYITYTCPNGMKCRDNKLHERKYLKEVLDYEFEFRRIEREEHSRNTTDFGTNENVPATVKASNRENALRCISEQERIQSVVESGIGLSRDEFRKLWQTKPINRTDVRGSDANCYKYADGGSNYHYESNYEQTREFNISDEKSDEYFVPVDRKQRTNEVKTNHEVGVVLTIGAITGLIDVGVQLDSNVVINKRKYSGKHERKNKYKQKMKEQKLG
ncbi:relaxase/mobilization nuclease domain-containing protein [Anaerorhabdus furcosa]|uniref:Relaxase/Mobilisation nuclease domain-containing protein n=1 Tax=Anaerorhabdus furcosa TaxID=118967 RepID=A0A1T4K2Y0_9FIRM|nr:relaxase/mobilization nuclease domain-containing protein [Anaerorhabdus furcosa]SJZ36784.1 Relaxase/Mobilisation nuclease domain-containing protein [Anaerorhabdus furcosa]